MKRKPRCPICRQSVELRSQNPTFPFCSDKCQMIDLGRWMNEDYRLAPPSLFGTRSWDAAALADSDNRLAQKDSDDS